MATLQLTPSSRLGSQLTSAIDKTTIPPESDNKNDLTVRITADENVSGLKASGISLRNATLVSIDGSNASWEATVRPPETATEVTFTVNADAFAEGNPETTITIRVSTTFPDADAVELTQLFASNAVGITVTPTLILLARTESGQRRIAKYTHSGTNPNDSFVIDALGDIDYINGDVLVDRSNSTYPFRRYRVQDGTSDFHLLSNDFGTGSIAHSRLGYMSVNSTTLEVLSYNFENRANITEYLTEYTLPDNYYSITHQADTLYLMSGGFTGDLGYAEILPDDSIEYRGKLNVRGTVGGSQNRIQAIAIYRDTVAQIKEFAPSTSARIARCGKTRKPRSILCLRQTVSGYRYRGSHLMASGLCGMSGMICRRFCRSTPRQTN